MKMRFMRALLCRVSMPVLFHVNQGVGLYCEDLGSCNMTFPRRKVPELMCEVKDVLPSAVNIEIFQALHQQDILLVQFFRLATGSNVQILKAEGVEGHIEEVDRLKLFEVKNPTLGTQEPTMQKDLRALHATGTA